MKKGLLSFLVLFLYMLSAYGQTRKISGKIADGDGLPLSGVSVSVKGKASGTQSGPDGSFTLTLDGDTTAILIFSHTGYQTLEEPTGKRTSFNITLLKNLSTLDDVIVIGYGSARKKDLTGSVGTLAGREIMKTPVPNAAEALTGRVAGVQVTTTEGSPDADIKIRFRGGGSISQDNSPLYIVDGFPVSSINNIAASDIETMTFLKDAASTAIYGSRAANGVILITTKEGKAGKMVVTGNFYAGSRQISKVLDVMSPYEFVKYQYEIDQTSTFQNYYGKFQDLDIYKSMDGTDWQKEVFGRTALQQYYNIGVSGGSKATRFNLGFTRNDEDAVMINSGYERNNLMFKLNSEISKNLTFDFNTRLSYMLIDGAGVNTGAGANSRLRNSVKYAPTRGLRALDQSQLDDDINSPEAASLLYNPVESANDEYKNQRRLQSNFNGGITWKIKPWLSFRTEGGYEFRDNRTDIVWGPTTSNARQYGGQPIGRITTTSGQSWRVANFFTIDKQDILPGHNLNVVLGQEALSTNGKVVENESRFFPQTMKADEVLANMGFGTPIPTYTYQDPKELLSSWFGRINYAINSKYMATFTFRSDGSSKFAEGYRRDFFPSTALAWRISEEEFLKDISWLNQLKLRVSYGTTGNNRIGNGLWQLVYNTNDENKPYMPNEQVAPNLIPGTSLANPKLIWETTINRNAGVDFEFLRGRISGSVDYYWNTTKDLLLAAPLAASSGYLNQMRNIGSTSNRGVEIALNAVLVNSKDFNLSASFNIAFNKNKVDEFRNGDASFKTYTSGWNGTAQPLEDYLVREGYPVGQMYGYVTDGMYGFDDFTFNTTTKTWDINSAKGVASNNGLISPSYFGPGTLRFKDLDGNGVIDQNDKTIIGDANPKHMGGFNLTAGYKGIDLSAFFNWTYGNDIYNANKIDFSNYLLTRKYQNLLTDMNLGNRFTLIDPETGLNVASGTNANPERLKEINQNASIWHPLNTVMPLHSWAIEDGSFLRLNTLTVGYTLPATLTKKWGISNLRIYATGYNLHIWTNYTGYDPEVDTRRNPPVTPGVDYSAYPKSRSFIGGINVTF
ncbi:MAG: TonB-dependent receptor [Candidatus Pseudobacter hemicellulosilyticus]|uniref:TonB-dependent receptor n=1 Tax=Candidatus Pseudobacter hemicellulosilyticus TaxID=3121375 RepID=A0AAJ5WNB0_9BACT|nr:MAG: TonB-dependent receptor [Pseudobacter sp.]